MKAVLPRSRPCSRTLSPPRHLSRSLRTKKSSTEESDEFLPALSDEKSGTTRLSPLRKPRLPRSGSWQAEHQPGKQAIAFHSFTNYAKARCTSRYECLQVEKSVTFLDPAYFKNTTVIEVNPGKSSDPSNLTFQVLDFLPEQYSIKLTLQTTSSWIRA